MKLIWLSLILSFALPANAGEKIDLCLARGRSEYVSLVAFEALERGYFKTRGLDVALKSRDGELWSAGSLTKKADGIDLGVATAVAGGRACVFGSSELERVFAQPALADEIRPLMISHYGGQYDTYLVVANASKIRSIADLKGKTIRTGGLPTHVAMISMLKKNGLTAGDVRMKEDTRGLDSIRALYDGRIDAMTAYLPLMSVALASGKVRVLVPNMVRDYVVPRVPHSMLIVNPAYAKAHAAAVDGFMNAMREADAYIRRNPAEVILLRQRNAPFLAGKEYTPLPAALVERASTFIGEVEVSDIHRADTRQMEVLGCDIRRYAEFLRSQGLLQQEFSLSAWVGASATTACPVDAAAL